MRNNKIIEIITIVDTSTGESDGFAKLRFVFIFRQDCLIMMSLSCVHHETNFELMALLFISLCQVVWLATYFHKLKKILKRFSCILSDVAITTERENPDGTALETLEGWELAQGSWKLLVTTTWLWMLQEPEMLSKSECYGGCHLWNQKHLSSTSALLA